ncbi:MAG: IPT/TIG domain-containing protein, partial [Pseudomonadota bacterium]
MGIKHNSFSILVALGLSCLILLFMSACGGDETEGDEDAEVDAIDDGSETAGDAEDDASDAESEEEGIEWDEFAVTRTAPNHGPFSGGTPVLVRGRGFEDGALVYFGEHMVQLPDTVFIDDNRIQVKSAPAGSPGPVDVKVVIGEEEAVLEDGYTYDVFYVNPASGSVAGGTYVEITGHDTNFQPGSTIAFDGDEAVDVDWVSETKMTCRTPMGSIGPADVVVEGPDDDYEAIEAYEYYNSTDPVNGGLGGGPIDGAVNVTILNAMSGEPVEDAFCIMGTSGETVYQGLTNAAGQITFSGPDLSGRQIVTASKEEFESTTIEEFDAKDVTIFLVPTTISMGPGELPPPRLGATVHGELVFEHAGEFGPGPWEIVPNPGPNEEKVAFVYGTGYDFLYPPPNPGLG